MRTSFADFFLGVRKIFLRIFLKIRKNFKK